MGIPANNKIYMTATLRHPGEAAENTQDTITTEQKTFREAVAEAWGNPPAQNWDIPYSLVFDHDFNEWNNVNTNLRTQNPPCIPNSYTCRVVIDKQSSRRF